jgi:hypothetical protein
MGNDLQIFFQRVLVNSLSTDQVYHLGKVHDPGFNMHRILNISERLPIPRQTAAQVLVDYFNSEEEVVRLFNHLVVHEGKRFNKEILHIWKRDQFIKLLEKYKWIYDDETDVFLRDPFYEQEINLLKKIKLIDLRHDYPYDEIIKEITSASKKLRVKDLEWRVTARLYDIEGRIGELIRKIIGLLLTRQNLEMLTPEIYTCLKELAINASKANYKKLYDKHVTSKEGITEENDYHKFLEMFRNEISEHGNRDLLELARKEDQFINIIFQSSIDSIGIWVTNNANISVVEKRQILTKLRGHIFDDDSFENLDDDLMEGAGFGINLILNVLRQYTEDDEPLKVVFYPDFIKVGFFLYRSDMAERIKKMFETGLDEEDV